MKEITVYTRSTCAPCRMLKSWLQHKGLAYREINIDQDPTGMAQAFALSGRTMVPVTLITMADDSQQVVSGYNLSALASLV